jgi:CheY-like chemotaxis protein
MSFESEPGVGSTFKFTIKLQPVVIEPLEQDDEVHKADDDKLVFKWRPGVRPTDNSLNMVSEEIVYVNDLHRKKEFESLSEIAIEAEIDLGFCHEELKEDANEMQIMQISNKENKTSKLALDRRIANQNYEVEVANKKILIVDDQSFNIDAALIILNCGVGINTEQNCDIAFNGKEALSMVQRNVQANNNTSCSYELILMDCNMPFMDGYDATQEIRKYLHSLHLVQPIILAVTGHTE